MLLTHAEAVRLISIRPDKNVTAERWDHWIASGHVQIGLRKGRTSLVCDDEVAGVGLLPCQGLYTLTPVSA